MIVKEFWRGAVRKRGYKANISAVVDEMEAEQKRSGASLAKVSGIFREKKKQRG